MIQQIDQNLTKKIKIDQIGSMIVGERIIMLDVSLFRLSGKDRIPTLVLSSVDS